MYKTSTKSSFHIGDICKYVVIGFFLLFQNTILHAQVRGAVIDALSQKPLMGVHVRAMDSDLVTTTNDQGFFLLKNLVAGSSLLFTYVGYRDTIVVVNEARSPFLVAMKTETVESAMKLTVTAPRIPSGLGFRSPQAITSVLVNDERPQLNTAAVDLLRNEPGVFIQQTTPGQGSVYVRGRAGRDVLYLYNGLRMNPAFVRAGQNQYFGVVDPFATEQIDVIRGSTSTLYGTDALSGSVNTQGLMPRLANRATWSGQFVSQANVGGTQERSGHGRLRYSSPKLGLLVFGTARDFNTYLMPGSKNEEFRFPFDNRLDNADYQFYSFGSGVVVRLTPHLRWNTISTYNVVPGGPRFDRMTVGFSLEESRVDASPRNAFFSNTDPLSFGVIQSDLNYKRSLFFFDNMQVKLGFHRLRDHRRTQNFKQAPTFPDSPTFILDDAIDFDRNTNNQWILSWDARKNVTAAWSLSYGADVSLDKVQSRGFRKSGLDLVERNDRFVDGSELRRLGAFAQLSYSPNSRFHLDGSMRVSQTKVEIPFQGVNSARGLDPLDQRFEQVTGSFGASYQLYPHFVLAYRFSTGFRAPNVADLSELGIRRNAQFQTPNGDLEAEKTLNNEISARWLSEAFQASLTGFWLHYTDKIETIVTGNVVDEGAGFIRLDDGSPLNSNEFAETQSRNAAEQEVLGVEFSSQWSTKDVDFGASFTYIYGELELADGSREPVDRIPPANGRLWLDWKFSTKLRLQPVFRYALAKPRSRLSPSEVDDVRTSANGTGAFVVAQVHVKYRINEAFQFGAVLDNLFNTTYREHASGLDGLRRNATLNASWNFGAP